MFILFVCNENIILLFRLLRVLMYKRKLQADEKCFLMSYLRQQTQKAHPFCHLVQIIMINGGFL